MSSKNSLLKMLIAKDVAVAATGVTTSNATDGAVVAFKNDWTQLGAAETIADSSSLFITQRVVNSQSAQIGNINSSEIVGARVKSYKGEKFRAGQEQITYIGLAPAGTPKTLATGTGSIVATSAVEYSIAIIDKSEKEKYQVPRRYYYTSGTSATQLEIANAFTAAINGDTASVVTATTVGNGTGTAGLTAATAWGIKIKGDNASYFFEVGLSDTWETTTLTYDTAQFPGTNTIAQLAELEKFSQGAFGYFNRYLFSSARIPLTSFIATQSNSTVAGPVTVAVTINSARITFSAAVTSELIAGDAIYISGVKYVIATAVSTTVFDLTEPYVGATNGTLAIASVVKEESYNTIVIESDTFFGRNEDDGNATRPLTTIIAIPSYVANATALTTLQTALNSYMATTPYRFPAVSV